MLYLKLARVDVGNVSKKGKNMKGIITWSVFGWWFLTELCLYMSLQLVEMHTIWFLVLEKSPIQ